MILELNDHELQILTTLIASELHELPTEIRHTDERDYREMLKDRKSVLQSIQQRLGVPEIKTTA